MATVKIISQRTKNWQLATMLSRWNQNGSTSSIKIETI